jgi:hypothetical protein
LDGIFQLENRGLFVVDFDVLERSLVMFYFFLLGIRTGRQIEEQQNGRDQYCKASECHGQTLRNKELNNSIEKSFEPSFIISIKAVYIKTGAFPIEKLHG